MQPGKLSLMFFLLLMAGWPQVLRAQTDVANANNSFAFDLYSRLKSQPGNLLVSPYSIDTAFAMTWAGARGKTAEEMAQVLHLIGKPDQIHDEFAAWSKDLLSSTDDYQLNVANSLWAQQGYPFRSEFVSLAREKYAAEVNRADFIRAPETARQQINGWVAGKTQNKITDLIPSGSINSGTRLVLTNALYFKAKWATQFDKSDTVSSAFHLENGTSVNVPMMYQEERFGYAQTSEFQLLVLPYVANRVSMIVILPRDVHGLGKLEESLNAAGLQELLHHLSFSEKINVALPRFRFSSRFNLADTLSQMGMPHVFKNCDLSGISDADPSCIAAVFHQAYIEVDEAGTEAAAATAIAQVATAMRNPPVPIPFHADHPFLFLICDNHTGGILFLGRILNPLQ